MTALITLERQVAGLARESRSFAQDLSGWVSAGLGRFNGADRRSLTEQFTVWVQQEENSGADAEGAELRRWIDHLDQPGREALTEQLSEFCGGFEIELIWLVSGRLEDRPELERLLSTMVTRYCLACMAAVDADIPLRRFRRRYLWQSKLRSRPT